MWIGTYPSPPAANLKPLALVITSIVKEALLRPLLKKAGLDLGFNNSYPVSNLSYLLEVIKWAVCEQLIAFTSITGNTKPLQSA